MGKASNAAYWKRTNAETQRAKRIARHTERLAKQGKKYRETSPQDFPKTHRHRAFSPQRVVLNEQLSDLRKSHELGHPIFSLVCNGRILQQSLNESECLLARPYSSRLDYQTIRQKSGGFRDVRSFRVFN